MKNLTVDMVIGIGLVIALLVSIYNGGSTELQTNIASGLIGYLGKTTLTHVKEGNA